MGIGLSLLLLIKAAGNYSLRLIKLDRENGSFVYSDNEAFEVRGALGLVLTIVLSFCIDGEYSNRQSHLR